MSIIISDNIEGGLLLYGLDTELEDFVVIK